MKPGIDYVGTTVVYACHDGKGNYFLNKRGTGSRDEHGRWDCGGGKIELHDTVEETLRKEIKEEYLTDMSSAEFLGYRDMHREHEGTPTHWIAIDFKVLIEREVAGNGEPHKFDEVGWFRIDDIPHPLHTGFAKFLEKYRDRL
jgi:8-oxo-dGTP pyrophosphatase MutT (NUDIX family)